MASAGSIKVRIMNVRTDILKLANGLEGTLGVEGGKAASSPMIFYLATPKCSDVVDANTNGVKLNLW